MSKAVNRWTRQWAQLRRAIIQDLPRFQGAADGATEEQSADIRARVKKHADGLADFVQAVHAASDDDECVGDVFGDLLNDLELQLSDFFDFIEGMPAKMDAEAVNATIDFLDSIIDLDINDV